MPKKLGIFDLEDRLILVAENNQLISIFVASVKTARRRAEKLHNSKFVVQYSIFMTKLTFMGLPASGSRLLASARTYQCGWAAISLAASSSSRGGEK